jgi:predicted ester cyclase
MQRAAGPRVGAGGVAAHRLQDGGPTFALFAVIIASFLVAQRFLGVRCGEGFSELHHRRTGAIAVITTDLSDIYRDYIACLNKQDWPKLEQFVHDEVYYNGRRIGLSGYRGMLERDFHEIPDLYFNIHLLIADPPYIASRLGFDCTPKGKFLGLEVNGKRVSFTENVFYEFRGEKIGQVWSVIDKAAIEAQL